MKEGPLLGRVGGARHLRPLRIYSLASSTQAQKARGLAACFAGMSTELKDD